MTDTSKFQMQGLCLTCPEKRVIAVGEELKAES
jgi:hypothetical protein